MINVLWLTLASIILYFLPGYLILDVFFKIGKMEKILVSPILSIATISILVLFYNIILKISINFFTLSIFLVIFYVTIMAVKIFGKISNKAGKVIALNQL